MLSFGMYCEMYGSFKLGNHVGSMSVLLGVERANQKGKCPHTGLHAMKCGLKYNWEVNKRPLIVIIQHAFSALLCSRSPEPIYSPSLPLSPGERTASYSQFKYFLFRESFFNPERLD